MKSRGRPPLDATDRSVPVSLSLPSRQFDELCARARRESLTVPELIRRALETDKKLKNRQNG